MAPAPLFFGTPIPLRSFLARRLTACIRRAFSTPIGGTDGTAAHDVPPFWNKMQELVAPPRVPLAQTSMDVPLRSLLARRLTACINGTAAHDVPPFWNKMQELAAPPRVPLA